MKAAKTSKPEAKGAQIQDDLWRCDRKEENRASGIDDQHNGGGGHHAQKLFLCEGIDRPGDGGQEDEDHPERVVAGLCKHLSKPVVEEERHAGRENEEAEPLCLHEAFLEEDEGAHHRHGRGELDEHLRRTG